MLTELFSVREKLNDSEEISEILQEVNASNFWDSTASFIFPAAKMFVYFLLKERPKTTTIFKCLITSVSILHKLDSYALAKRLRKSLQL